MIHFEFAKSGEITCYTIKEGQKKYIYSKYAPSKMVFSDRIDTKKDGFVVFGAGLGYEIKNLLKQVNKNIYVVEALDIFKENYIFTESEITNIHFLEHIDEIKKILETGNYQLIINQKICELNLEFYKNILKEVQSIKGTIICIKYHLYMDRIVQYLLNFGYDVVVVEEKEILNLNKVQKPLFIFSLNFSPFLCDIAIQSNIKYVSWIIDIPNYLLYINPEYLKYSGLWVFHFDEDFMKDFDGQTECQMEYLPLAGDERLDTEIFLTIESQKYACDVSFIGALTSFNEINKYVFSRLSDTSISKLNSFVDIQKNANEFVLDKLLTDEFIHEIKADTGISWEYESYELMGSRKVWGIIIARYVSYLQRASLVSSLAEGNFNFHLYGEEEWKTLNNSTIDSVLKGTIPYYPESYKVFKQSKININDTRPYFKKAIPLRIYDILSVRGFLVTNNHNSNLGQFEVGKDIVVYRDTKDLIEIIEYYMEHEQEREEIANHGYETLKSKHSLQSRIRYILKQVLELKT